MISLQRLEDAYFTLSFLHMLAEDLQRVYRSGFVVEQVFTAFTQVIVLIFFRVLAFITKIGLGDPYLE